jgi:hypothetical protein
MQGRLPPQALGIDTERDVLNDDEGDLDIDVPSPDQLVQNLSIAELSELEKYYTESELDRHPQRRGATA